MLTRNIQRGAPTGALDANTLYFGDNGRCHCGRLDCAGQAAFFSGVALDGQPVVSFDEILKSEPQFDIARYACEGCGRKLCPECRDALMEKMEGVIAEPVMRTGTGAIERRARPAVYWACAGCEHCAEVNRG